jgi:hypothetical protein
MTETNKTKLPFNQWLRPENIVTLKPISNEKLEAFEYFVMNIYDKMGCPKENDLSMIKLQALLFLSMSAYLKNKKDDADIGLLSIFDNWYAMPYGNVERDIFEYYRKNGGQFNGFKINVHGLEVIG